MSNWMDIPMRVDPKGIGFEIGAGIDLPDDFYNSMDANQIAEKCWNDNCSEMIKAGGVLKELLEKAKRKGGFGIDQYR